MTLAWRYFKVSLLIRLLHTKFLVNGALFGKRYYRVLIGNHRLVALLSFDDLEGHVKVISVCHFHVQYLRHWQAFASRGL